LKDSVYWEHMDCVEINTDSSNGHNCLEPKPLGLGLTHFLNIVIRTRLCTRAAAQVIEIAYL